MDFLKGIDGTHKVVRLGMPGQKPVTILCLVQNDTGGAKTYYILAESDAGPLRWRSMVRGNAVHRLRDELVGNIMEETEADEMDVEMIFFLSAVHSNA